ncbi:MAG: M23 family metallopeptidase [Alphaproteobacteria bacterium]
MSKIFECATLTALCALTACSTWTESDQPYLRATKNLIPGERVIANEQQNVYTIAKKYNVSIDDLIVLNQLRAPYKIWPGQTVTLPLGSGAHSAGTAYADAGMVRAAPVNNNVQVSQLDAPLFARSPGDPTALKQAPQPLLDQASIATGLKEKFVWPVDGPVLSGYGLRNGNVMNDGINIASPRGTPVQAAANGIVVHAGNEGKYGNIVLVRHGSGVVTAYAHLDRMVVDKDSVVAKGDMVGTVGSTGDVKGPQLHFEIRRAGKPVDPQPLLPEPVSHSSTLPDLLPKLPNVRFE